MTTKEERRKERERLGTDAFEAATAGRLEEENPTDSPAPDSEADAQHEQDEARAASSSEPPRPVGKSTEGLTVGGSAKQPDDQADDDRAD
jgi:hypothetical protein